MPTEQDRYSQSEKRWSKPKYTAILNKWSQHNHNERYWSGTNMLWCLPSKVNTVKMRNTYSGTNILCCLNEWSKNSHNAKYWSGKNMLGCPPSTDSYIHSYGLQKRTGARVFSTSKYHMGIAGCIIPRPNPARLWEMPDSRKSIRPRNCSWNS